MSQSSGDQNPASDDASSESGDLWSVASVAGSEEIDTQSQLTSEFSVQSGQATNDNLETDLALIVRDHLPASTITNPDDGPGGVFLSSGQDRLNDVLKAEQVADENRVHGMTGFEVHWDEAEPANIIAVLEDCGPKPTLLDDRKAEDALHFQRGNQVTARKPFDPKAPHFDVIVISLPNSQYFPTGVEASNRLSSNAMDRLPVESLLGRPGFVLINVGNTPAGLAEGLRLFSAWSVKRLEACRDDGSTLFFR
ncbi:hypothetical protein K440DRAFT_334319 [Wilcoxina mikolae CBS 423.85]|nr:hypothetical protein K440DRAFT_334319 [Wilcoxina mikolae CBS 423.85]